MAWARMRREPCPDPKVRQSATATNLYEFGGIGRLHAVRLWLDQHSEDGTKVRMSSAFLGRVRACPGFADARRAVVRLSGRDRAMTLPGHAKHHGEAARRGAGRSQRDYQRREAERWRDKCPTKVGTGRGTKAGPDKIREEKEGGGGGTNLAGESKEPPPPELAARGRKPPPPPDLTAEGENLLRRRMVQEEKGNRRRHQSLIDRPGPEELTTDCQVTRMKETDCFLDALLIRAAELRDAHGPAVTEGAIRVIRGSKIREWRTSLAAVRNRSNADFLDLLHKPWRKKKIAKQNAPSI